MKHRNRSLRFRVAGVARSWMFGRLGCRSVWPEVFFGALSDGATSFGGAHAFFRDHGFRLYPLHEDGRAEDGEMLHADALRLPSAVHPLP